MSNLFPVLVAPRWPRNFAPAASTPVLLTLLGGGAAPVGALDTTALPAPRLFPVSLRTAIGSTNLLLGKDSVPPGGYAHVYDLPPRAPYRVQQTWTQMDLLLGKDTMLPGLPARVVEAPPARFIRPRLEQTWTQMDLLLGQDKMLAGGAAQVTELPPRAPYRIERTWIQGPLLLGQDAMPPGGANTADDLAPARLIPFRLEQTWVTTVSLLGSDTMLPGGPARADAPAPAWMRPYRIEQTWRSGPNLLGQDVMLPGGSQRVDALPTRPYRLEQSWAQSLLESTLGVLPMPFVTTDWPVPARAYYSVALRTWATPAPGLLGQDVFPPGLPNQPVEHVPAWLMRFRIFQDWQMNFFVAPTAAPFANYDWPLPQRSPLLAKSWLQSPNLLGKDTTLPGLPSTLTEAPPARFVAFRIQQSWTQANYLLGSDTMLPGGPARADAPVPTARVRIEQTWTQVLLQTTLAIVSPPPANYDWPLPKRAALPVPTWSTVPLLLGQDQFPPGLPQVADDPVPRASPRLEQTWTQDLLQATLAVLPMPFVQHDWLVPTRAAQFVRAWTQGPLLLGKDVLPPGLPRRADDPVPTRAPLLVKSWAQVPLTFGPPPVALLPTERIFVDYSEGRVRMSYSEGSARLSFSEGHVRVSSAESTVRAVFEQGTIRVTLERL